MKGMYKRGHIWCGCDRNEPSFGTKCEVCGVRLFNCKWILKKKSEIKKELSRDEIVINMNGM